MRLLCFNLVRLQANDKISDRTIAVLGGNGTTSTLNQEPFQKFIANDYHWRKLTEIVQSYAVADICLIG